MANNREEAVRLTREKVTIHEMINFDKKPENPVKVSIVVPVCNVEKYLRECIDSCINQTLRDIEIICVNDGSTDSCPEILREYAERDERVKVVNKDNAGYGHTMNLGMDLAQGEYIGIVESDDFVVPEMYEELYDIAYAHKVDICRADFEKFETTGGEKKFTKVRVGYTKYYNTVICPKSVIEVFKLNMQTWAGIYAASFLREFNVRHNETPGASYQDNGFFLKSYINARGLYLVDKVYYKYRFDNPNSSINNPAKVYCVKDEFDLIEDYIMERSYPSEITDIFVWKKFRSFLFSLNRIGYIYKKEFLGTFSNEMKKHKQSGHLNRKLYSPSDWETVNWIINDPIEYFYKRCKNPIKVSVIVAVYNAEEFLDECLSSISAQELKEIEIICIDDGSTDASLSILQSYAAKDKRFRIVHQDNKGAGAARNEGMKIANGEYLSFLDADDVFDSNMLSEAYKKSVQCDLDICMFKCRQFDNNTGKTWKVNHSIKTNELPEKNVFAGVDVQSNPFKVIIGWAWDKIFRRSFIENNDLRFMEQRTTNDMYFVFMAFLKAGRVSYVNKTLVSQRQNNTNSLSATRDISWECFLNALYAMKQELINMGMYEKYERQFVNYALHCCLWNLKTLGYRAQAALLNAIRTEWAQKLDILNREDDFWEDKTECRFYNEVIISSSDNISALWLIERDMQIDHLQKLAGQNRVVISETETLSIPECAEKLVWNRKERERLSAEIRKLKEKQVIVSEEETMTINDCVDELLANRNKLVNKDAEIGLLALKLSSATSDLEYVHNSVSFRIGRFITWLPRMVRKIFNGR